MKQIFELLRAPSFLEKLVILLITAALTGVLVPVVSGWVSEARFREQKVFEAELQRQREIVAAQAELLKSLSALLWEFQLLNIDVSFYKVNGNEVGYRMAVTKYQSKATAILGQIRAELSASRRLLSPLMHQRLSKLYFETLLQVDASLERLVQNSSVRLKVV